MAETTSKAVNRKHIGDRQPGELEAYRRDKCRCYPCCNAWSRYEKRRKAAGWKPLVDVQPIRDHIAHLIASGVPPTAIARRAGVSLNGLAAIRGIGPATSQVNAPLAARILAVRPEIALVGANGYVDGTGTYRRLQALQAKGFPCKFLARRLQRNERQMHIDMPRMVRRAYADAVRRLYDELWDADPRRFGLRPAAVTLVRKRAAQAGWALPAEWDDDQIDNPRAHPRRGHDAPRYAGHRGDQLREDARFIIATSPVNLADRRDRDAVAARLAITTDYLDKLLKTAA